MYLRIAVSDTEILRCCFSKITNPTLEAPFGQSQSRSHISDRSDHAVLLLAQSPFRFQKERFLFSPDGTIINCQVIRENELVLGHQ